MSEDRANTNLPPQYIVTTPSEADADEERSLQEIFDMEKQLQKQQKTITQSTTTSKVISQSVQKQTKRTSRITSMSASSSQSIEGALTEASSQSITKSMTSMSSNRCESLKSASFGEETTGSIMNVTNSGLVLNTAIAAAQLKAQSQSQSQLQTSTTITTNSGNIMQKTSTASVQQQQQQCVKSKFQSFLQQPEAMGHMTSSGNFLTAHQKHVRQFVRSTSAHSEATAAAAAGKDKCVRSASTQQDDLEQAAQLLETH